MQSQSTNEQILFRLEEHLKQEEYCRKTFQRWTEVARRFLRYLDKRHIAIEVAEPSHINSYLTSELRLFRQRYHRSPYPIRLWRNSHAGGIRMLLRLARGCPLAEMPCRTLNWTRLRADGHVLQINLDGA